MDNGHIKISIPKIYKRSALDLLMFGFVQGMKTGLPTLSTQECLILFHKKTGTNDTTYPIDSAKVIYNRMQDEFNHKETNCFRK